MSTPTPPPTPVEAPASAQAWRPTQAAVAALLRARTKDTSLEELGAFGPDTRPTAAQVEELIDDGQARVALRIGWEVPDWLCPPAAHFAALYAAVEVEESYFPEQTGTDHSARDALWERFMQGLLDLRDAGSLGGSALGTLRTPSGAVADALAYGYGLDLSNWINVGLGR